MAKPGRKSKPTAIKKANGNPGRRKLSENEPDYVGHVSCPSFLSAVAKTEWRRLYPLLTKYNLVTPADRAAFAAYCQSWADYVQAIKALQNLKPVVANERGMCKNPWTVIADKAFSRMMKVAAEFGLTPSSRSQLATSDQEDIDELEMFIDSKPQLKFT